MDHSTSGKNRTAQLADNPKLDGQAKNFLKKVSAQ